MEKDQLSSTEEALLDYKEGMGTFEKRMPELAHHYYKFTAECFKEGELSQKQKQLIALGISVYAQDEYCIIYHLKECLDKGCSEKEVLESLGVAAAFGGGAAMSQAVTLVQEAMDELGYTH
ncbi:carboxymuconolactone decarboxylase family protein [Bacillus thermotolerans]|uniref:Carboxymuconolactone decarboxylase n=1 Tax=Bacillus thermotolerans TaxID=1221996 RepID=A0A0F5HJF8_BACTR|nr:carboxymuconolactone decarboxylase family protein [Bacillus thermotolerans]KKB33160.1 carboxymuconolactone decarboxylase [Bacillus thermotolerans]KKB41697.1 carboxymuconolactone decarboxylase [Bacillus thermotolerans]